MELSNVVGMKDSSGLMGYFHQVLAMMRERRPDWALLVGPEQLLAESVLMGGHGAVCGGSNLAPGLFVQLYDAASAGNLPRVLELQQRVMQLSQTIYAVANKPSAFISGLKAALSVLGICDDVMGPPHQRYNAAQRQIIERHVKELNLASYLAAGAAR
jgi:4-hydroxy-tetrahydrodipicolinate synthase